MNLLFDTNILIHLVKEKSLISIEEINPNDDLVYISIVSLGEIYSIATQNQWKRRKMERLEYLLQRVHVVDISESLINAYIEIDSFSQRRNPNFDKYSFNTPRNMGKNDLWIAATTYFLNLQLVTTDNDFGHLESVLIDVKTIAI